MRAALLLALGVLAVGCSRAHYRRAADLESYSAIAERNQCPAWALPRTDITPAPQLVSVSSSGAAVNFTAAVSTSSGGGWLSVNPSNGSTPA